MIFDEPEPWFWALPEIERIRAIYQGLLPLPPVAHLLGVRAGSRLALVREHGRCPAAGMFETEAGTLNYFPPMRPEPGNLLARARVINASRFFVFSEVEIEDPQGRLIARASSHLELRRIEPPPPAELHSIASVSSPASRRNVSPGKKMTGIPLCGCSPRAPSGHHINTALRGLGWGRSKARKAKVTRSNRVGCARKARAGSAGTVAGLLPRIGSSKWAAASSLARRVAPASK
jgi:hypothetical protein